MWRAAAAALSLTSLVAIASSTTDNDEEVFHIGVLLPLYSEVLAAETVASIVHADLEFGKYQDPPKHKFLRPDGSLMPHYLPIPNPHPNLTRLQLHIRDSAGTAQAAAVQSVAFAYGSDTGSTPPMNMVVGPILTETSLSSASILSVLGVPQITLAQTDLFTDKSPYPYLFRMGYGNSEYGRVMWDYLEFFGFRGGHMIYEDEAYGNELRSGMSARAEARRRSGDIHYFLLPEIRSIDIEQSPDGMQDAIFAAEVATANIAKEVLASFHRLIFFAMTNVNTIEVIVKKKFLEERVTAPYFQIVLGYASQLYLRAREQLEGHAPQTFHGLTTRTDYSDPSLWLHRESWLGLTAEDVLSRLPDYGLDASKHAQVNAAAIGYVLQIWPPPLAALDFALHASLNMVYRAVNDMLHDGYRAADMRGDVVMQYLADVSYAGFGGTVAFNEDRDVLGDVIFSCAAGWDETNRTLWIDGAIRKPVASDGAAMIEPIPNAFGGSTGLYWATGDISWYPPTSLVGCPLGSRFIAGANRSNVAASSSASSGLGSTLNRIANSTRNATANFSRALYGTCELCPAGQFSDMHDSPMCEPCQGGTISDEGSSRCSICPAGSFALQGSPVCTACFAGSYGDVEGASACASCLHGRYQGSIGQTQCLDCPIGTHAPSARAEECLQCSPGTSAPHVRSATCIDCAPGFFQDSPGASDCLPCNPGSYAEDTGEARCSQCRRGSYQPNVSSPFECERCPAGTYSASPGASACEQCVFGTTLLLGADRSELCTCPVSTFLYEQLDSNGEVVKSCVHCNEYMEPCPGGETPAYQKSGYHVGANGQTVYQCMSKDACPGGLLGSCPIGSSGPGCADCDAGSYYWDGDNCAKCTAGNAIYLIIFPMLIVAVLLGTHRFGNDPIGRQHLSALSEGIVLAGLLLSVLFFFSSFEALDVSWKEPVATVMDLSRLVSTELLNMNFSCSVTMGPSASMAFMSLIPVLLMMPALLCAKLRWASAKLLFNTYGSIVYAAYLLIILHGLTPFRYIVHPMADRKSILVMPNVFEHSGEHHRLVAVGASVLLVYCLPFAALSGWASIAVMRHQPVAKRRRLLQMFRFLFYKFRPHCFYWGFYILIRNTIVGLTPSLFPESPSVGLFLLSAVIIQSAVLTGIVWPWRARWMNYADAGTLSYLALVLNLATGWVRQDEDSDGLMATMLVVVAAAVVFVAAIFAIRLLWIVIMSGAAGRAKLRASAEAAEEAIVASLLDHFSEGDPDLEMADGFESLRKEASKETNIGGQQALAPALTWISTKTFEISEAASIASQIRKRDYSLQCFYEDCMSTFPELQLYVLSDGLNPDMGVSERSREPMSPQSSTSTSGRSGEAEQQRTIGALFAIYWICRLDIDGKQGMSFGVDLENAHKVRAAPSDVMKEELQALTWGKMTPDQKRTDFFHNFNWRLMVEVFQNAGILQEASNGRLILDDAPGGRLVSLLCLTAFHDIMKCAALCPRVVGEPYHGYVVGETIKDHDIALAYILDRHPNLLPSFRSLSEKQRHSIRFTQSDMGFNAGWLVQAEGPPSTVLGKLKKAITSGMASDVDVAFYFSHFLTDLAGAEPTPFHGAEKFAVKFPPKVLQGLLGCVGTVKCLAQESETQVYERYLEKRWFEVSDQLGPLPTGAGRITKLRLNCMAQHAAKSVLDALDRLSPEDFELLTHELAATGVPNQFFSEVDALGGNPKSRSDLFVNSNSPVGPPFLTYYGPAWCQRAGNSHPDLCLRVLVTALKLARATFNDGLTKEELCSTNSQSVGEIKHYTIQLAALRTIDLEDLQEVVKDGLMNMGVLQMERLNSLECSLVIQILAA